MFHSTLSLTTAIDGVGGQHHAPATLPPRKTRYPLYRRLGGPHGRSEHMRNISHPPGFDPRTVQPVPTELSLPRSSNLKRSLIFRSNILFLPSWKASDYTLMSSRSVTYHRNNGVASAVCVFVRLTVLVFNTY